MNAGLKVPSSTRAFVLAGWVLVGAWIYIHAFVWAVNARGSAAPYLEGLPWWSFVAASMVGFYLGPLWLLAAIGGFLLEARRGGWPRVRQVVLFAVLAALLAGYWYRASLD